MGRVKNRYHDDICNRDEPEEPDEAYLDGVRAAIDGMDLPDGAYCAMMDEFGLDPF